MTLPVGQQSDSSSCGICVINAIKHHMFETVLFTHSRRNSLHAEYFTKVVQFLVNGVSVMSPDKQMILTLTHQPTQLSADCTQSPIAAHAPLDISPSEVCKAQEIGTTEANPGPLRSSTESPPPSINDEPDLPSSDIEIGVYPLARKRKDPNDLGMGGRPYKKTKQNTVSEQDTETDEESRDECGGSRSAAASRKLKDLLKSGQFVVDKKKRDAFEGKCRQMDGGVKFRYGDKWEVLHRKCGNWYKMTEPYNTTRFKAHLENCRSKGTKGRNACISDFFLPQGNPVTRQPIAKARSQVAIGGRSAGLELETPPVVVGSLPCLGLRENHDVRIPGYISRALTEGAGARSESRITAELFGRGHEYSKLGSQAKQLVQAAQVHSRIWSINRELQAIYSTSCEKVTDAKSMEGTCSQCLGILGLKVFKKALNVGPAPLAAKKFIPRRWRTAATDLAINLAEINGLPGLLEAVS